MQLKSGIALIGAFIAVAAIVAMYFTLGINWIFFVVILTTAIVGYILAAIGASFTSSAGFSEFMRGLLIGWNSAANGFLLFAVMGLFAPIVAAAIIASALGVFTFLSIIKPISQNEVYQGFLGYINWVLPMSWLIVGLGFTFYLICFLLHGITLGKVNYLKIRDLGADWKTGTFFIKGGLISNLNPIDTAFNMGNFAFVDYRSGGWHKEHEAGHTLNLAVFGSIFHLIGALDENATRRGANAYSERIAESNDSGTGSNNIPMWA